MAKETSKGDKAEGVVKDQPIATEGVNAPVTKTSNEPVYCRVRNRQKKPVSLSYDGGTIIFSPSAIKTLEQGKFDSNNLPIGLAVIQEA